jgi:hypothetical protein
MTTITADPRTLPMILRSLTPGTVVQLAAGVYTQPVEIVRQHGRPDAPIVIRGVQTAVFDGLQSVDDFTPRAEEVAHQAEAAGHYPGVYPIADEAHLKIRDCAWITLDALRFRRCWPTALWLKDCTDIAMRNLAVEDSSYAIYAVGQQTRRLLIDRCTWVQDPTRHRLWRDTYWKNVHGDQSTAGSGGARAYDGTFFLGDGIAGDLEIRNCTIEHAFNGIHLFNRDSVEGLSRNVYLHHNRFRWVKDNPFEPEDLATNWWIYENEIFNNHKWFSFELPKYGYFYVFRNVGYFDDKPGPPDDENSGGAVFKLPKEAGRALGPVYTFNNSWFLRSSYIKDGAISHFHHLNNAIQFCSIRTDVCDPMKSFFGKAGTAFTKDWQTLDIRFVNDLSNHVNFPSKLQADGYGIEDGRAADPMFEDAAAGRFELKTASPCCGQGRALELTLPDGTRWSSRRPLDIGAAQTYPDAFDGLVQAPNPEL